MTTKYNFIFQINLAILFSCLELKFYAQDSVIVDKLNQEALDLAYSDIKLSLQKSREAISISQKIGYCKGEVRGHIRIGIAYDVASKFDSSYFAYEIANKVIQGCRYSRGIYAINNNLGLLDYKNKKLSSAASYFFKAFTEAQNLKDDLNCAIISNNIGLVFLDMKQDSEAESYFLKSLNYFTAAGKTQEKGSVYNNLGRIYENSNNSEKALQFYSYAIDLHKQANDFYGGAIANSNAANSATKIKGNNDALKYYFKAKELHSKLNNNFGLASVNNNIGLEFLRLKDSVQAVKYFKIGLEIAKRIKDFAITKKLQLNLSNYYQSIGDTIKANLYLENSKKNKVKIDWEIDTKTLAEASSKFKTEQAQMQSKFLKRENKLKEKNIVRTKKYNLLLTIGLFSILALFVAFIVLAKTNANRKKKTQMLQLQLDLQESRHQERSRIAMDLHDNLGSQLAYVTGKLDIIEMRRTSAGDPKDQGLDDVKKMSKQAISTLRETVWALEKGSTSLNELIERFRKYAESQLEIKPDIEFSLINEIEYNSELSSQVALNIYRIVQEGLSNAILHSNADLIKITFSNSGKKLLKIALIDDGIGFSRKEADSKNHFGLSNLETRTSSISGAITITSEKDLGTCLNFEFPMS